jgi:hypothetical protein
MARATRTRSRKRRRARFNPTSREVATWAGAVAAAGLVGYGAYRLRKRSKKKFELPEPPQGTGEPTPIGCELGPAYPGFILDSSGACVPTSDTPPGIYVDSMCTDFAYVPGDDGPQPREFDKLIWNLVAATRDPRMRSADPTYNVTNFLRSYWPDCTWPPVGGTPRLQQLFNVLSLLIGKEVVHRGGHVLGTGDLDTVDEQVAARLAALGMPEFDPDVVPEIELPKYEEDEGLGEEQPPGPPGPGPDVNEPEQPGGGVDLPPGGQGFPSDDPVEPVIVYPVDLEGALRDCQKIPWSPPAKHKIAMEDARWTGPSTHDFLLFDFDIGDNAECVAYNVRFGLCLRTTEINIYGEYHAGVPIAGVHLRNADGTPVNWESLQQPALWKRQYKTRVGLANGKAVFDAPTPISDPGVDPCPDDATAWPSAPASGFIVDVPPLGEFSPMNLPWMPRPRVELVAKNRKVYVRLFYSGMPKFLLGVKDTKWGGVKVPDVWVGEYVANRFQDTAFKGDFKMWSLGTLPA